LRSSGRIGCVRRVAEADIQYVLGREYLLLTIHTKSDIQGRTPYELALNDLTVPQFKDVAQSDPR
jgi:hypothetical protein